jgi:hypothetical protein
MERQAQGSLRPILCSSRLHSGWLISQLGRCTVSETHFDFIHHQSTRQKEEREIKMKKREEKKTKRAAFPIPL